MKKMFAMLTSIALLSSLIKLIGMAAEAERVDFEEFDELYAYDGQLGALYTKNMTTFRLWAPTAEQAAVNLYPSGNDSDASQRLTMERGERGTWEAEATGDLNGTYYTYTVVIDGSEREAIDPYAKAAGVNGRRAMVVDLEQTNPDGWGEDKPAPFTSPVDAVIYELHVRDLSTADSSGMENKGKYLAFTETGTKNPDGLSTGVDHMKELGVTHVHLLPVFDFLTINEAISESNRFNWGYDPQNYNLPEGSYSTDPFDGFVRINEFKQMVQSLHANGLRVVMDVVFNHTGATEDSNLNLLVPNYYYRQSASGGFSDGSACGNETASERAMVRKLIVDSVVYWATEYHIDGFRFDLMGLHDIETMNAVRAALDEVDPSIIVYGEGWTGGNSPLPESERAVKKNTAMLNERIAAFSDDMRDGIKGDVFNARQPGYINGDLRKRTDVMFGVVGSVEHPQVDYIRVSYSKAPWAIAPTQTINYASAHDNLTLWDKLNATRPDADDEELVAMNKLSALLVLTSQGIPFFQAGEEFARSKDGNSNSYKSPDSINQLKWENKTQYYDLFEYYKGLIALRKAHPAFRLQTAEEIASAIEFIDTELQVLAYTIDGNVTGGDTIAVAVNADSEERTLTLPQAGWTVFADGSAAGTESLGIIEGDSLTLAPMSGYVLANFTDDGDKPYEGKPKSVGFGFYRGAAGQDGGSPLGAVLGIIGLIAAGAATFWFANKREKKR